MRYLFHSAESDNPKLSRTSAVTPRVRDDGKHHFVGCLAPPSAYHPSHTLPSIIRPTNQHCSFPETCIDIGFLDPSMEDTVGSAELADPELPGCDPSTNVGAAENENENERDEEDGNGSEDGSKDGSTELEAGGEVPEAWRQQRRPSFMTLTEYSTMKAKLLQPEKASTPAKTGTGVLATSAADGDCGGDTQGRSKKPTKPVSGLSRKMEIYTKHISQDLQYVQLRTSQRSEFSAWKCWGGASREASRLTPFCPFNTAFAPRTIRNRQSISCLHILSRLWARS